MLSTQIVDAIVQANCADVFSVLGAHREDGKPVVRTFQPGADSVEVIGASTGATLTELQRKHSAGLFAGSVPELADR